MIHKQRYVFGLVTLGVVLIFTSVLGIWGKTAQASTQKDDLFRSTVVTNQTTSTAQLYLPYITNSQPQQDAFVQHGGRLLPYNGAATCQECHAQQVHEFGVSNHYQWRGKLGVINDFCGFPDINFGPAKLTTVHGTQVDGGCATCHAGMGEKPTATNFGNADCLMCHANEYRRTLVFVGGTWRFTADRANMPATISIQREPTRYSCLACHAYAGGGCNNKRGDISDVLANPTESQDVHMANNMTCVDCHLADEHRIAGRGVDLRIDEGVQMRACTECHNPAEEHDEKVSNHLEKVACQSCHIPHFARAVSTDMLRDFRSSEVNARGLYEPKITFQSNVVPEYAFWNGQTQFYDFLQPATEGMALAQPLGNINDGKLFPFKLHSAIQPFDPVTQALIPVKAGILFQTGNIDQSIRVGAQEAGINLTQGYGFLNTQRWMGIFHEMPPSSQALRCAACHEATDRIDFTALGYAPKTTRNGLPICQSCHNQKEPLDFYKLHDKHVKDKNIDCVECHNFNR